MILLIHCYSRNNAGDGLLVDLAIDLLRDAGARSEEITILALDAPSFTDSVRAVQLPWAQRSPLKAIRGLSPTRVSRVTRLFHDAQLIVAVGGGYMRFGNPKESLKTSLAHLPQLILAARSKTPCIYLPQSIGPAPRLLAALLKRMLMRIDQVYVRDDLSRRLLSDLPQVTRTADMAALSLPAGDTPAQTQFPPSHGTGVAIVARALPGASHRYLRSLRQLEQLIPDCHWLTQSAGRGNDDVAFMDRLGVSPRDTLANALRSPHKPAVVVSVRLHGALQAIRSGVPAVHLSYERKGFGAFSDLGLDNFVFPARRFDPSSVADATLRLIRDPAPYWDSVRAAEARLKAERNMLVEDLASALAG